MSAAPSTPARVVPKYSVVAPHDKNGRLSFALLLTLGPAFAGSDHTSDVLARTDTHTSSPPNPPGRLESKKISRPSLRRWGRKSFRAVLSPAASTGGCRVPPSVTWLT